MNSIYIFFYKIMIVKTSLKMKLAMNILQEYLVNESSASSVLIGLKYLLTLILF